MDSVINGVEYSFEKLDAFSQLHLVVKMRPILSAIKDAIKIASQMPEGEERSEAVMDAFLNGVMDGLSAMKPETLDEAIRLCLKATKRRDKNGTWSPVLAGNGQLMFNDIDASGLLQISSRVVMKNLESFFPIPQPTSPQ